MRTGHRTLAFCSCLIILISSPIVHPTLCRHVIPFYYIYIHASISLKEYIHEMQPQIWKEVAIYILNKYAFLHIGGSNWRARTISANSQFRALMLQFPVKCHRFHVSSSTTKVISFVLYLLSKEHAGAKVTWLYILFSAEV